MGNVANLKVTNNSLRARSWLALLIYAAMRVLESSRY
jgi:hypothetical protein